MGRVAAELLPPGVVPVGPVIAPLAWLAGIAAAGAAYQSLLSDPSGASWTRRVGEGLVAGWVLGGMLAALLAVAGVALGPAASLAPVAVLLAIVLLRRPGALRSSSPLPTLRPTWLEAVGGVAVLAVLARHLAQWPWGQPWSWDVYAVWGFKARYLVSTGGLWRYLRLGGLYPFSHAEYPPLLPAHLAAVSWPAGTGALAALPDVLLAVGVLLVWYALWRERLGGLAAAAMTLLLAWPGSLWAAHLVGLADRPLALLAGLAAGLVLAGSFPRDLPLACVCLGGVALLKNEGLPLALLLGAALVLAHRGRRATVACGAALLPAAAWLVAMMTLGLRSDRFAGHASGTSVVPALERVGRALLSWISAPDLVVVTMAGTLAALLLLGAPKQRWVSLAVLADASLLVLAVILGPYDLSWQIRTALPRLATQLLPALVACVGAALVWLAGGGARRAVPGGSSLRPGAEDADAPGGSRDHPAHDGEGVV
jgi:hypothetical protein